jgi:hypothetical protein
MAPRMFSTLRASGSRSTMDGASLHGGDEPPVRICGSALAAVHIAREVFHVLQRLAPIIPSLNTA